jgi:hypothetical protein
MSAFRGLGPTLERQLARMPPASAAPSSLVDAYACRVARSVAGAVACVGGVLMFASTVPPLLRRGFPPGGEGLYTEILLGSGGLAVLAYAAARIVGGAHADALGKPQALTGDTARDLAILEARPHLQRLARAIARLELASVALPLAGCALLAPLTIHFAIGWMLHACTGTHMDLDDFDRWISASTALVGLPHFVLASCGVLYARKLRRLDSDSIEWSGNRDWLKAFGFTVLVSVFPNVFLVFVPTLFVVVTGLAFIPATFRFCRARALGERRAVEHAVMYG